MFIDRNITTWHFAVRRSGTQVDRYPQKHFRSSERRMPFSGVTVYKHLTPKRSEREIWLCLLHSQISVTAVVA